jgi:phage terminase large subunit
MRESVCEQLSWGKEILGVKDSWKPSCSPLKFTCKPTGKQITFRGGKEPKRVRSVKLAKGYFKFIWYEELDEFYGMEEVRTINQIFLKLVFNFS